MWYDYHIITCLFGIPYKKLSFNNNQSHSSGHSSRCKDTVDFSSVSLPLTSVSGSDRDVDDKSCS